MLCCCEDERANTEKIYSWIWKIFNELSSIRSEEAYLSSSKAIELAKKLEQDYTFSFVYQEKWVCLPIKFHWRKMITALSLYTSFCGSNEDYETKVP
jgi:hypothetical protein